MFIPNYKRRKYGWKPDVPDLRDKRFSFVMPRTFFGGTPALPPSVDLRPQFPIDAYDQLDLGSCTANALGAAVQFDQIKQGLQVFIPSRLFIYYNERDAEHDINTDGGAQIRTGIKVINKYGVCPESMWPYITSAFTDTPGKTCYDVARFEIPIQYRRLDSSKLTELKYCLSAGFPFVFGFTVYDGFESEEVARTGVVQLPDLSRETSQGGHAVMCVGYDDHTERFIVRNSWGTQWGDHGHFTIPYAYLTNPDLADDFWTITQLKSTAPPIVTPVDKLIALG